MLGDSGSSLDLACLGTWNLRPSDGGREWQGRCCPLFSLIRSPSALACSPVLCSQAGPSAQDLAEYACSVFTFVLCLSLFLPLPSEPSSESHSSSWGLPCNILSHLMSLLPWLPKHMAWAPRFWHLDYFSALVLSSPTSSTLSSARCPHKHHMSSIINFMRAGMCLTHFYIIGSTWQRPRPLRALKLNRILAMYCNHRPDLC